MTVSEPDARVIAAERSQLHHDMGALGRVMLAAEADETDAETLERTMRAVEQQAARVRRATQPRYREYLASEVWRLRADSAKERVGYRCQVCYGTDHLEAHHRTYKRLGHERPEDITVLCRVCHGLYEKARMRKRGAK